MISTYLSKLQLERFFEYMEEEDDSKGVESDWYLKPRKHKQSHFERIYFADKGVSGDRMVGES